ncbi:arsenate reductase ArsC [Thermaerobacter marianensis]|nr:arsenate reductase ArsC [Thermaerobacter marianensis]
MFLCTGNSARSQMAEGLARSLLGGAWEVYSAGLDPKGVHPLAVRAMDEIGIDIRAQSSKPIDPALLDRMDLIVTLCDDAAERCPVTPPHVRRWHWPLPDPAAVEGTEEQRLAAFRRVRDELHRRIRQGLLASHDPVPAPGATGGGEEG